MILDTEPKGLDWIDVRLVSALAVDCKTSLNALGELVGLSAPSVMERLRKLEAAGVIRGYHALIDARKVGLDVTAFIGVSVSFPDTIDTFRELIVDLPGVLECHHVTGRHTFLLKVKTRNTESLERLLSHVRKIDGVGGTETMVALSTQAERVAIELEPPADVEVAPRRRRRAARKRA